MITPGRNSPRSAAILAGYGWVPPAGFEPALTAPEGVAPSGPDQRKRACGRPFWTRIGHRADSAGHVLADRRWPFTKSASGRRVSLTPTRYTGPAAAGMTCHEDARAARSGHAGGSAPDTREGATARRGSG